VAHDAPLYPVSLVVAGRPCLVVGGGHVAARKIEGLLACGADVTAVAPEMTGAVEDLAGGGAVGGAVGGAGSLQLERRPYRAGEASAYRLVVTATGLPEIDHAVAADAEAAGVWVNSADDPANCSFLLPAVHRDGPVTVAVSTGGSSPALAGWLRTTVADALGPHLPELAALLDDARGRLRRSGRSTESIDWRPILDGPVVALVRDGRTDEARTVLWEALGLQR
jgi:siroheme synthase-like protein